ncbi:MAG: OprO/OprP family phosphate-selective porin [Alistipes sp.]|nr:OprO/OprP family phosphate-selective porin [Alistipes sp.]
MKTNKIVIFAATLAAIFPVMAAAQTDRQTAAAQQTARDPKADSPAVTVDLTGTVRAKFEYQPTEGNARFSVRTARFGVGGEIYSTMTYEMEIDLSDEGRIRMVEAHVGAKIWRGLSFNIGYMRVPFTIDAHRSPHLQLFANRSFIAKQMGNVRDVGATLEWKSGTRIPMNVQIGMFNGSGLDEDLRSYWTRGFNYSAKVQAGFAPGLNVVAGYQTTLPQHVRIHMYNAGITYQTDRWLMDGEYLRKNYSGGAFAGVDGVDAFVSYGLPIGRGTTGRRVFRRISLLGRYDYMSDHSGGIAVEPVGGGAAALVANDPGRHRATAGVTFSLGLPFSADVRLNYEKYFYTSPDARRGIPGPHGVAGPSDHDKIVVELMAHF